MKTRFKYLTFVATVLLLGLGSCSNDDEKVNADHGAPKKVSLKISKDRPSPKSEGSAVTNGSTVTFTSGDLYFVSEAGVIVKHYPLSASQTSDSNINLTELEEGATIDNIPATAQAVYITGNTTGLPVSENISAVKATALAVQSQVNIENVNLYGTNTLTEPAVEGDPYTCAVTLSPVVARIEMTDIQATGIITGFTVDGIFVDSYYVAGTVAGTVSSDYFIWNGEDADAFEGGSLQYPSMLSPAIYDWYADGLAAVDNIAKPATEGDVWGYNVFAPALLNQVPRIIIRLSNITTSSANVTFSDPQFVTIRGFISGGNSLTGIVAGNVYNIGSGTLNIDETIITPEPNEDPIDVEVSITLATWTVNNVTPDI